MEQSIEAVRGFNRFFTQFVGALTPRFLDSDLSLAEARLLFEIARGKYPVATDLQTTLGMDAGYVSRVLRNFETRGLIRRPRAKDDARRRPIELTAPGRALFETIDARQREKVMEIITPLDPPLRRDLVETLATARILLEGQTPPDVTIRTFRTGDVGRIVARQAVLYDEAYGWGSGIETVIAETAAMFLRSFKPGREQCWVAEANGVMAGSILLTDEGDGLARLRLFYVEPFARRLGLGSRLVDACLAFSREAGYDAMTLWTHTVLESARRIYAARGFRLVETKMHEDFGKPVQGETWRLDLNSGETRAGSEFAFPSSFG